MSCTPIGFTSLPLPSIPPIPPLPGLPPIPAPPSFTPPSLAVPVPSIPSITLVAPLFYGPDIATLVNQVAGIVPCCHFQISIPGIEQYIALLNAAVAAQMLALGPNVQFVIMTINETILQIQAQMQNVLNKIPNCPSN